MSLTEGKLPQNSAVPAEARLVRKRALIVSFYWPPSGGGGVQRWLKFAKLLPGHGWQPIVVTPSNPDVPVYDPTLLDDVTDDIEVWSFPIWEPSRVLRRLGIGGASSRLGADGAAPTSLVGKIVRWVRGNMFVPDARVGWVRPTTRQLLQRLKTEPVDVVVTTGPPHSMHLIGLALKRATGLPWVADFRDPWSTMDYLEDFGLSARSRATLQRMEREVVAEADCVLVTSPGALKELGADPRKGHVLPNGWDRDDFPDRPQPKHPNPKPVLGHFGALYGARDPKDLWPALAQSGWVFRAGGQMSDALRAQASDAGVDMEWMGDLGHQDAIQTMLQCDALLVAHNDSRSARSSTPGKIFECLATGLPLIVVGPADSDLEAHCRNWNVTFVAHGEANASTRIATWLKEHAQGHSPRSEDNSARDSFERHAIASDLADVLNSVHSSR